MQAVKALVIGLGIMIVAGIGLLVYGISQKAADPSFRLFQSKGGGAGGGGSSGGPAGFGETRIALPEGCRLIDLRPDGQRLYLHVGPTGGCERIIILNSTTGQVLGSIWLRP